MSVVLLADKMADKAFDILTEAGFEVLNRPGLGNNELKEAFPIFEAVTVESSGTFPLCAARIGTAGWDLHPCPQYWIIERRESTISRWFFRPEPN